MATGPTAHPLGLILEVDLSYGISLSPQALQDWRHWVIGLASSSI